MAELTNLARGWQPDDRRAFAIHDAPWALPMLVGAAATLVAVSAARLAHRVGISVLLAYLALGVLLGESGAGIEFHDATLTREIGYVALAVILVDGGLNTRWTGIRPMLPIALSLGTLGVAVSAGVTAVAAYLLLDTSWTSALVIGAILAPTDAAAVFATLRNVPLRPRLRALLEAESGLNDPLAVILVVSLADTAHSATWYGVLGQTGYQLSVGLVAGLLAGWAGRAYLGRIALPASGLYPLAVLSFAGVGYAAAAAVGASGFLAVYVAGLLLGNGRLPHRAATLGFAEGFAWVAQIGLFVMLGLLASPGRLPDVLLPAAALGVVLLVFARPLSVLASTALSRLSWSERGFVAGAGLRGAVPIVLATVPLAAGGSDAARTFDLVFVLVAGLTLIQAPLLPRLARRLGVVDEGAAAEIVMESAPLALIDAELLHVAVGPESRLHGMEVWEIRLPTLAAVSLLVRDGRPLVPEPNTRLRYGDQLLVVVPRSVRKETERRLLSAHRRGSLAEWKVRRTRPRD